MRWTSSKPGVGDTRKQWGFLWLPKTIDGQTRWLEYARWEECYGTDLPPDHPDHSGLTFPFIHPKWHAFRWLPTADNKPDKPYKIPDAVTDLQLHPPLTPNPNEKTERPDQSPTPR